ncbi:hypothetical protein EMPS_11132 [Entomortierella parvispora]|uniref:Uncharacterized protein n=1 Tax=Entomortierella parvispora TaxID=205924 RepID=A0A9P3M1Y0_9FUNG|nr:hypothetical protein EMPS_11132 [Entomortierella parvispora]
MRSVEGGQSAGSFASAWLSAKTTGNNLDVELTATTLTVGAEQFPAFKTFLEGIATKVSHAFTLGGTVDVDLSISASSAAKSIAGPFGAFMPTVPAKTISIPGVGISLPITLGGLNNFGGEFQSALSSVSAVTNIGGVDTAQFKVAATNPSTITILFGDVDFQVWTSDVTPVLVGIASVTNLNIVPGVSICSVVLKANAGVSLSTYFPAKEGLKLVFTGFDQSSKFPITAAAASSMKMNLVFKN